MNEGRIKTGNQDAGADCSARPVWIRVTLYEAIRRIRKEKGGNIASVVEELIEMGIRCRNAREAYNMQCRLCELSDKNKLAGSDSL